MISVRTVLSTLGFAAIFAACGEASTGVLLGDSGPSPQRDAEPIDRFDAGFGSPDVGEFNDCFGCRFDGESCQYSINCMDGRICNVPEEELYDPSQPQQICIRVVCNTDRDCAAPKECTAERLCRDPVCQLNEDCAPGLVCIAGECSQPLDPRDAATCRSLTRDTTARIGSTVELAALAFDANGVALPGLEFGWRSSNELVARPEESVARIGPLTGSATLMAFVIGRETVNCAGPTIFAIEPTIEGSTRVLVVREEDGAIIQNAAVTLFMSTGPINSTTGSDGSIIFSTPLPVESVTASMIDRETVSVLEPNTNDISIALPRKVDRTRSAGFRGSIDLSGAPAGDMSLGVAGGALPFDLSLLLRDGLCAEPIPTTVDAPELGLPQTTLEFPANFAWALGSKQLTDDGMGPRCHGRPPGDFEVGCYLARGQEGLGAAWTLAGKVRLSQAAAVANQLSDAFGAPCERYGTVLAALSSLSLNARSGIVPSLNLMSAPKVPREQFPNAACSDPSLRDYEAQCRSDFSSYQPAGIAAQYPASIFATVNVPPLPRVQPGRSCADTALLLLMAELPGRGYAPLGFSAALDDSPMNCLADGIGAPFGPLSPALAEGQMRLAVAPRSAGSEEGRMAMVALAFDRNSGSGMTSFSAIVEPGYGMGPQVDLAMRSFLPNPDVAISRMAASVAVSAIPASVAAVRLEFEAPDSRWIVYAPAQSMFELPASPLGRAVLAAATRGFVVLLSLDGPYSELWTIGSQRTIDRPLDVVRGFSTAECTSQSAVCTLQ